MSDDKLQVTVEADATVATSSLQKFVKSLDDADKKAKENGLNLLAERYKSVAGGVSQAAGILAGFTRTVIAGTAAHEANERALRTLGSAYEAVARQTNGAFSAAEALRAQQSLVQSGLRINSEELGVAARAAREYAIATGTDATQALDQLTGALRGGEAEGLRAFGVTLAANTTRTQAFTSALSQLTTAQRGHAPEAQTMAEANAQLSRSWDQMTGSLLANVAQWTDLRGRMAAAIELMGEMRESGILDTLTGNTSHSQQNANSTARLNNRVGAQERYTRLAQQAQGIAPNASFGHARSMTDAQLAAASARLESLVARAPAGAVLGAAPSGSRGMASAVFGGGRSAGLVFGDSGLGSTQADIQAFAAETVGFANAGDEANRRRQREALAAQRAAGRPSVQRAESSGSPASYDATLFDLADQINTLSAAMMAAGLGSPSSARATYADSADQLLDHTGQLSGQLSGFGAQAPARRRGENAATYAGRALTDATAFVTSRAEMAQSIRDKQSFQSDFALNEAAAFGGKRDVDARAERERSVADADAQEEMRLAIRGKATGSDAAANDNARRNNVGAQFRDAFLPAALETQTAAEKLAEGVSGAFSTMTASLKSHVGAWITGRESLATAAKGILHDTLLTLATEAAQRSAMSLGGGLAALAVGSPTAGLLFASAGVYAGVAAVAGLGAAATASAPQASAAGAGAGGGRLGAPASAGPSSRDSGRGATNLTLIVQGSLLDSEGLEEATARALRGAQQRGLLAA